MAINNLNIVNKNKDFVGEKLTAAVVSACDNISKSYNKIKLKAPLGDDVFQPLKNLDSNLKTKNSPLALLEKAVAKVRTLNTPWEELPTRMEYNALRHYKGSGYALVNQSLRGGVRSHLASDCIAQMDSVLSKVAPIKSDAVVYRGVSQVSSKDFRRHLGSLQQGDVFQESAYVSTSLDRRIARSFASEQGFLFTIHMPKGTRALNMSQLDPDIVKLPKENLDREAEILLPRRSTFKVLAKTFLPDGTTHIECQLLNR